MKTAIIIVILLVIPLHKTFAKGGGPGNGGDAWAQDFVTRTYQLAAVLDETGLGKQFGVSGNEIRAMVSRTSVSSRPRLSRHDEVTGKDEDVGALNFPADAGDLRPNKILVSRAHWDAIKHDPIASLALPYHEWAGLLNKEVNRYDRSAPFALALEKVRSSTEKKRELEPIVLFESLIEDDRKGLERADAEALCRDYQRQFAAQYYYVSCVYLSQSWEVDAKKLGFTTDYEFLGYVSQSNSSSWGDSASSSASLGYGSSGSASATAAGAVNDSRGYGLFRRSGSAAGLASSSVYDSQYGHGSRDSSISGNGSSHSSSQIPEVRSVQRPYAYTETVNHAVYGLRILGIGPSLPENNWKLVFDSRKVYDSGLSWTYATEEKARIACVRIKNGMSNDVRFDRAECDVPRDSDRYYFRILTQNPFVPGPTVERSAK